ncbi:3-deoxy-manno-octulosonate cytidylyltransferase [Brachyspira pilosicoli]|uniref:3-deoxy-manno-octulosonate cytidylyltransferase n=1 Tax=Brachyspira pilosicoli TaxID=52584 RepID=UPI003004E666
MKIIGVIPARYKSTRFPGKPLADICGKPMIWWVYQNVIKVKKLDEVYVATDDERITNICSQYNIKSVMTSTEHKTHLDRLSEFASIVNADFYINVNGDEPIIEAKNIEKLIPNNINKKEFYVANAMTTIKRQFEIVDTSKIKVVTDMSNYFMYMARTPIPYPKSDTNFVYKKFVGIQCFSKSALEFCRNTKRGNIENIEDIDEYRFLENGKKIKGIMVSAESFSVDTQKDLDNIINIIKNNGII